MGVGKPDDIVGAVQRGIDMFDCVLPTRSGRTGQAFTADGPINLRNARFAEDQEPIEPGCPCPACTKFERAYVHHLVRSGEILGAMLMTEHNLWFYQRLMQGLRDAIAAAAAGRVRERISSRRYRSELDRVVLDACGLVRGDALILSSVRSSKSLASWRSWSCSRSIAGELVDDPPALDRRARVDLPSPSASDAHIRGRRGNVGAFVAPAERDAAVPGPDRDVGDRYSPAPAIYSFSASWRLSTSSWRLASIA